MLVLYDNTGTENWRGPLYIQLLRNLLSHFEAQVTSKPVEDYVSGEVNNYDVTFYMGIIFDNPIPDAFLADMLVTDRTVAWLGYNLQQMAWGTHGTDFTNRYGLTFVSEDTVKYTNVTYKNTSLTRVGAGTTLSKVAIASSSAGAAVSTLATASNNAGSKTAPYILHSQNLFFVADNPFTFVTATDRYLAFADVLFDILGVQQAQTPKTIVRIEDVSPMSDPVNMRAIADYLSSKNFPFMISVIPEYRDPLGAYNSGVPLTVKWKDKPQALSALRYMLSKGGRAIQHGYTHQYQAQANPFSGVTAEDWEFFIVTKDANGNKVYQGPTPEDSYAWALGRVLTGQTILHNLNIWPVGWLTPHYLASPQDYAAFARVYPYSLDRGVYFVTDSSGTMHFEEQIAPYVLKDVYGITRIPETCEYVNPTGTPALLPADVIAKAAANTVVRDGWAGFYFHWYIDVSYLQQIVEGITALGYTPTTAGSKQRFNVAVPYGLLLP
ncbi:DUF2334 domain-containing protein [Fundidesulfovibrio agrisoli]|uniref:DUF2334 domain-containing protein n=1 Tax=Fundidesulfovibrio agrisoli TaxID=2922717 RepID=UPI001FAC61CD